MAALKTARQFRIFIILGLMLSLLFACSPSASTNHEVEIEFWTMQLQPKYTKYIEGVINNFEIENPKVKINWVDVPWVEMQNKILSAVSANKAPDVVNLNPNFAVQLAAHGAWLSLNDLVSDEVESNYLPNIWKATTYEGKSFSLPWYLTSRITVFNNELFKKAGVTNPPRTYIDLLEVAKKIKKKTGKYAFFMTTVPDDSGELLESLVQMGVKLVDDTGKAAFNSPKGKAAFEYWTHLYQQELIPPEVITEGHRHAIELYKDGEIAILSSSPLFLDSISAEAPNIDKASVPAQQITGESEKINVAVMNLFIPHNTKNPDEAFKFAQYVTNPENQLNFAREANVLPSIKDSLANPYFHEDSVNITLVENSRAISVKQIEKAEVLIPMIEDVKKLQEIIYIHLREAMLGQKSVSKAISDAEEKWNKEVNSSVVAQYGPKNQP